MKSVGTLDLGPAPALPNAVWAAGMLGVDISAHRARSLRTGGLESADLVVGFEPFHLAAAVIEGGALRERAFLITELAESLSRLTVPLGRRPEHAIELANASRVPGSIWAPSIGDPVGSSKEDFGRTFEQISRLVVAIAVGLFGDRAVRPTPASRRRP